MATIKLTKVNIGSNRYYHVFKNNATGYVSEFQTTQASYNALAQYGASRPTKGGSTWVHSFSKIGFDTKTGNLSDNQYATQENGPHWVKIPDYKETKIPNQYIVNDILSEEGIALIQTMNTD
jgi:hypothetical protein